MYKRLKCPLSSAFSKSLTDKSAVTIPSAAPTVTSSIECIPRYIRLVIIRSVKIIPDMSTHLFLPERTYAAVLMPEACCEWPDGKE